MFWVCSLGRILENSAVSRMQLRASVTQVGARLVNCFHFSQVLQATSIVCPTKCALCKGQQPEGRGSWHLMKRATPEAGNRAGKIARCSQWLDSTLEWRTVTSEGKQRVELPAAFFAPRSATTTLRQPYCSTLLPVAPATAAPHCCCCTMLLLPH